MEILIMWPSALSHGTRKFRIPIPYKLSVVCSFSQDSPIKVAPVTMALLVEVLLNKNLAF